ncbi:hypothetical protein [Amycolatopsis sp. NPDC052450]|uniref:hypothetical protein n=1 Tax=Amycolatopsis sp. NPDC052450 TaxID=3363937 RepID=UPI0037CB69FF
MATANKDQQVKHVVEGVALGVLAAGVEALTSTKMALELSFNQAWRRWPPAADFPSLRGPDPGNLFWGGLHRSAGRQWASAAWENDRRWVRPYLRGGWSLDELDDCLEDFADERATANDWREFGRLYLERFEPDEKILA